MLRSLSSLFTMEGVLQILYRVPAILVALSFHEWAHAWAAYRRGDPTARNLGRMTLNPIAHIDPLGLIMLLLVRFGWAKPVPINPRNFQNPRRDEIYVSLAGVTVNLLLAFVSYGLLYATWLLEVYNVALQQILINFYFINLGLLVFNLVPIPPLDGYHVFRNLLIRPLGYQFFAFLDRYGSYILIVLLLTGVLTGLISAVIGWIALGMDAVWGALFGLFL